MSVSFGTEKSRICRNSNCRIGCVAWEMCGCSGGIIPSSVMSGAADFVSSAGSQISSQPFCCGDCAETSKNFRPAVEYSFASVSLLEAQYTF